MIFLVHYNRIAGQLVDLIPFDDDSISLASKAKLALEIKYLNANGGHEIVLLQAPSESDLKITHRRYFETLQELGNRDGKQ